MKEPVSGYEWDANVADAGLIPQDERVEYMERARRGEKPKVAEETRPEGGEMTEKLGISISDDITRDFA
jgi:hypothetical protein